MLTSSPVEDVRTPLRADASLNAVLADWFNTGSRTAWTLLATLVCATLPVFFSWPKIPMTAEQQLYWERYWGSVVQVKIDEPLHDYRRGFAPTQHEAKRNYRLTMPILARLTGTGVPGVHAFRFLLHFVLLAALVLAAERACGDRPTALGVALAVAGTYVGTSAWRDVSLWFDNCAHAFIALALLTRRPALACLALLLAAGTDERAVLALPLVLLFHLFTGSPRKTLVGATLAIPLYLLLRLVFASKLGFLPPTEGIGAGYTLTPNLKLAPLVYWFALEGGWLVLGAAVYFIFHTQRTALALGLAAAAALPILAATTVGDFTRSVSYGFPATLAAVAVWRGISAQPPSRALLRRLAFGAALVSLLMPNVMVMREIVMEQSAPMHGVLWFLQESPR